MSDTETNQNDEHNVTDEEILDVTILEDGLDEEPIVESAFDRPGRWYIVHTFAGHEQKVIGALNNIIKSRELTDSIYEIYLPEEDVTEFKGGKKVTVSKRMFPSYLLIRCEPDPEIFYVIGSTPVSRVSWGREDSPHCAHPARSGQHHPTPGRGRRAAERQAPHADPRIRSQRHRADQDRSLRHVLGPRRRDQRRPAQGQGIG